MTQVSEQLDLVGDALQRAWRADHLADRRRTRLHRSRRLLVVLALVALAAMAGGAAVAADLFKSADEEEAGLVVGHRIFEGSQPRCVARTASWFRCTLARPPTGMTFHDQRGRLVLDRFKGMKFQTVDATRHVDGGCVATSADGRSWDCYLGRAAVEHGIIDAGFLGVYQPEPATG